MSHVRSILLRIAHCASVVQPAMQLCATVQTGRIMSLQSAFARHSTHVAEAVSQTPVVVQSALAAHCTQVPVVVSHTGAARFLHSAAVVHSTHAPVVMSHVIPTAQLRLASPMQEARQVCVPGSQTSPAVGQSELAPHCSQLPRTQTLSVARFAHCALVSHCTHPRAGSQT
jgi:hypothetical protein